MATNSFKQCPPPDSLLPCILKTVCAYDSSLRQIASFDTTCSACASQDAIYFKDGLCPNRKHTFMNVFRCYKTKNPQIIDRMYQINLNIPLSNPVCAFYDIKNKQAPFLNQRIGYSSAFEACQNQNVSEYMMGACRQS